MPEGAERTRRVSVRFFRAVKASRSTGEWQWPDATDIREPMVEMFESAEGVIDRWPFVAHYVRDLLVEMDDSMDPLQVTVSGVRADDLPLVLRHGHLSGEPLSIDARDRLLEPSYLTFFADGVVGMVRNQHTPGHGVAATAIAKLTKLDLQLAPIPRLDVVDMIQRGDGVSRWDMTVAAGSVDQAVNSNDPVEVGEALAAMVPGADKITMTLAAETRPHRQRLKSRLLRELRGGLPERVDSGHAWITSEAGGELVDLLETEIATQVTVSVEHKTRHLLPESAHKATLEGFEKVRLPITRAIELGDPAQP